MKKLKKIQTDKRHGFKRMLSVCICFNLFASAFSQNLNVTLADQLTYGATALSNICGWKSPIDGKEYALVGAANGLSVVDITNPANVFQVTLVSGPNCTWREIKTLGNYAYVTTECGTIGLQIVDLTNLPATPLPVATWAPTISSTVLKTIHALHIDEAKGKIYLFGSNIANQGALIADIQTTPMAPIYLGKYDNRYIHDGYIRNDTMYACHIYEGDCEVVNVANPAAGVSIGDFATPNNFAHNAWLSADSKTCFTTDEVNDSYLAAFDVSALGNITELDRIQSNPGSNSVVHNTHIINVGGNDFAVTSWYKDGFTIVDAGRPDNLVQVGNYDTAPTASGSGMSNDWGVYPFFPSGTIVASDMANGLFVCSPTYVRASYLEGVVTDCITGNLLSGALVQIVNPPAYSVNSSSDITDGQGKYGVGVVTAGTYTVTVSKQAYISQTFTVSVTSGNVTALNVQLCSLTPPFNYTGNVFDNPTTNGVNGAFVHIQDSSLIWDTITDASGNFTIPNMLGGTYDILIGQWGYITKCFSGINLNSSSGPLSVGLDPGIYDDFSFDFGWTVSGLAANAWERSIPVGTYDAANGGATANPDADVQNDCSDEAFVTDNGGGAVSDHDVDPPGYTILTSPTFNPTAYTDAYVSYYRWFYDAKLNANQPNDTMNIYITNGSTTVLLERMIKSTVGNGTWLHKTFKISTFVTPSANMQIILSTSDAGPGGTIVEGGLDKFFVYDSAASAVNNLAAENGNVTVYPNPSNGRFTVYGLQSPVEFSVYNVMGEKVVELMSAKVKKLNSIPQQLNNSITLDLTSQPSGMYFYKITSGKEIISSGKLMIE
ncbi:MAG: choice-of-anchor B family protein [Bacteroidetes bacterium]|nr:choice-of-anchor B family protein [Bacteroidota bacterium]